ncbi:protein of unknown function (plasmid) [Agrobacterium pusense]|uniref:Uncharacterized protein n=1 Tax=Agrobacterium pusense TaxID=648995 RepID=U4Q436_9HYPH|nr:protein of unknown function [Agrobacterium pusense]
MIGRQLLARTIACEADLPRHGSAFPVEYPAATLGREPTSHVVLVVLLTRPHPPELLPDFRLVLE